MQVTGEALAGASSVTAGSPDWAAHTATYVGCMFNDYMSLLLHAHGWHTSGALLTGADMPLFHAAMVGNGSADPAHGQWSDCNSSM